MQISNTLSIKDGKYSCSACEAELGDSESNWKELVLLQESKPSDLGAPFTTNTELLLRHFCCPGCGVLLDSELAMPGDPFLLDMIYQVD